MLDNKKILFIAPSFFGYEKSICKEIKSLGASVDYYDERPFSSSLFKILNRLDLKFFIKRKIDNYYKCILDKAIVEKYDYLLVISPETLDFEFLSKLQDTVELKSILYMWDSFKNKPNANTLISLFDSVYSFDNNDVNESKSICYLPLFYTNEFSSDELTGSEKFAATFIGTVHSDRARIAKDILSKLEERGLSTFSFFYCPSKLLFLLKKMFTSELNFLSYKDVSFIPLEKSEINFIFSKSLSVLDIQHPEQHGLTMRTFEVLGMKRKLITTNKNVMDSDFYSTNNVLVIDRENSEIPHEFLSSSYDLSKTIVIEKYSLRVWVKTIFTLELDKG